MNTLLLRLKNYIQPFERHLALQELETLANKKPRSLGFLEDQSTEFEVVSSLSCASFAEKLAYWEVVQQDQQLLVSQQSLREATVNVVRNGRNGIDLDELAKRLPFNKQIPFPNRRCLRYGTHGIHEYRGKFFPQLVKSLINISNIDGHSIVCDPMIGSGTTAVEAILAGHIGLGLDMNPLSVFLGKTKCQLLSANPTELKQAYVNIRELLLQPKQKETSDIKYFESLPKADQTYLTQWFSADVLASLDDISLAIQEEKNEVAKNLFRVSLSNILRQVSWQKNDDLRVRKEIRSDIELNPKKKFLEEIGRSIRAVLAFLYQNGSNVIGRFDIQSGNARHCATLWQDLRGQVDTIITSPPYATALPYLDTDRLSLCYLSLLSRPEHRVHDKDMIGNREVTERLRREYWQHFEAHSSNLPQSVQTLIQRIHDLNYNADVGFRRRNLSALLTKYFFDMKEVLMGMYTLLKSGRCAFIVIGNNHTIAGGQRIDIETARLLAEIGIMTGFEIQQQMPMEMLVSRDIFKHNTMASEEILVLRKPYPAI